MVSSIPKAKKLKLDMPSETYKEAHAYYHSQEEQIHRQPLHSLTSVPSSSMVEQQEISEMQQCSRKKEEEIIKLRAVVIEKDLEILSLKSKLETCSMENEIMRELTSSMSEKISGLETLLQGKIDLEGVCKELQEMKTKLHDVTLKLGITASHTMEAKELEVEQERENIIYGDSTSKPTMLELLEKQQRLKEWVLETSSIPPSVLPSDSGLATSIVDVSEGSEPPGDFEQQFLQDLTMKREELVRKEEEITRLKLELDEARSSEEVGEAEKFKQNIRELETMLRTKNEEVLQLANELQHYHTEMENMQAAIPFNENNFYCMDKNPHGICVIINNHKFYHPTNPEKANNDRRGAEVDQMNLQLTFQYLRYRVEIYENLSHTRMMEVMLSMAQHNHTNYDSFICCILTHGEQNIVYGADSIPVSLLDLTGVMKMCTTLINKPKMFFIQCARGDCEEKGHKMEVEEKVTQRDSGGRQPPSAHTIPQEADFFFGYATPLGNVAYRSRRHGSWYISELCKVLVNHGYTSNLSNMMRKVNDSVCQAFSKEGYKQTTEFVDRLRRDVHFYHFHKVQHKQPSND